MCSFIVFTFQLFPIFIVDYAFLEQVLEEVEVRSASPQRLALKMMRCKMTLPVVPCRPSISAIILEIVTKGTLDEIWWLFPFEMTNTMLPPVAVVSGDISTGEKPERAFKCRRRRVRGSWYL
jgi:hypothetical protein